MPTLRTSAIAVSAGALVAGLAVLLPATGAEAVDPSPKHNWLVLQTGATKALKYYPNADFSSSPAPTATATQPLSAGTQCALSTNGALVAFSGKVGSTVKPASFASGSLGVAEKTSGTSCSRVDRGETLTLKLNRTSGPFAGAGLQPLLTSALLEVDLKQDARITAVAKLGGVTKGTFELQSGSSIGSQTTATVFQCQPGADSGSDSGARDNCYWPISAPDGWFKGASSTNDVDSDKLFFDEIVLKAEQGSFALQGGAETGTPGGAVTTARFLPQRSTFFELAYDADGLMGCTGTTNNSATEPGTATEPKITVQRLGNANPSQLCELIPYTLTTGAGTAQFLKPLDTQTSAQFVIDLQWTLDVGSAAAGPPVRATTIDFESGGGPKTLGWCPDPVYGTAFKDFFLGDSTTDRLYSGDPLTGIRNPLALPTANPSVTDMDGLPGVQFACLATQYAQVEPGATLGSADDTLVVHEQVYLLGDARMRK